MNSFSGKTDHVNDQDCHRDFKRKQNLSRLSALHIYEEALETIGAQYDLLLAPVAPTPAYKIGEKSSDPMEMALGDICTVPVNLGGLPAISVPFSRP